MTKLSNYLVTVTEAKEILSVSYGQTTPSNTNRVPINHDTGGFTVGTIGATPTFCLADNSPILSGFTGKCPVYQDFIPRTKLIGIVNTYIISPTGGISSPVINCTHSEFSYLISVASSQGATTGTFTLSGNVSSNITLIGTSFRAIYFGSSLAVAGVDYYIVAYNGNPSPYAVGYIEIQLLKPIVSGTPYNIIFNAQFNTYYGTFALNESGSGTDGCYGPFNNSMPNASVCIVNTTTTTTTTCGPWSAPTQYCVNFGVYPFQLRSKETNSCGQTRNDIFVANLSSSCGYTCNYWGLGVTFSGYYCNGSTNGTGVVSINVNFTNGSYEARLVSTGAGVTTGWLAGSTFTGVYDGTYFAEVRSTSDNACTAGTVGTSQNYQTVACCNTTPNWVSNGAAYCDACVSKQPQIDNNICSSSYNQTIVINGGSACNTAQNWVNTGNYNCYSTCNKYNVEIQNNPCASGYNTTRQGSVVEYSSTFCGGCCGQSTAANWVNSGSYNCYGSCTKYNVEVDNNGCSPTYNQTQQGSAVEFNSTFCGGCCGGSPSANWVNNGATFCSGCYLQQPQIDNNPCSSTYQQTRDVDLGVNTSCGTWVQSFYCVGYDKWSKETNSCTGNIQNQYLVEVNSAYCGYVPPSVCRTYQIIAYNSDEYVDGVYTNCGGGSDSFSFYGGPGTVGYICAQPSTVYVTSGNGAANDVGSC